MLCSGLWAQTSQLVIQGDANLSTVLDDISKDEAVLLAYPTELIGDIKCSPATIDYADFEDLLSQLSDSYALDYYKYDSQKFLIRKAQTEAVEDILEGQIRDGETGEALPLASVYWSDYSSGVFTDENGRFSIESPQDPDIIIIISYLGYETLQLTKEEIRNNSDISMRLSAFQIEAPIISYMVPPIEFRNDGAVAISSAGFEGPAMASGLYGRDLLRYVQLLMGVASYEDDNVNLKIRGSNAEGTRVILDGMPLYNVSHYYGIFSSVNSAYVGSMRLYKNAQPVEYEGVGGGLLLFESGTSDDNENSLDLSLFTAATNLNFDLTDALSVRMAGRTSYRNVNDSRLLDLNTRDQSFSLQNESTLISSQPDFRFYDINGAIEYNTGKTNISLNFFRSYDNLLNAYDLELNLPNQDVDKQLFVNDENWQTTAASFLFEQTISKKSVFSLSSYVSDYHFESSIDSELKLPMEIAAISNTNINDLRDMGIKMAMDHDFDEGQVQYGAEFKNIHVDHQLEADRGENLINYDEQLSYLSLFANYSQTLGKTDISLSNRTAIYNDRDKTHVLFSPQMYINHRLGPGSLLKFSLNRSNQLLREIQYETRLGQTLSFFQITSRKEIPVLRTDNIMLGYSNEGRVWSFDMELFYKFMKGNLLFSTAQPGFNNMDDNKPKPPRVNDYRLFRGDRRVYGVDLTLAYRKGNYSGWLAYTLSKNEDRYPQVFRGEYFAGQEDRRHQAKWINEWRAGDWSFNLNLIYASGRPYLALENIGSIPRGELDGREVLSRLPAYFRSDIAINRSFKLGAADAMIGVSVYNLTNRQNVKYLQYAYKVELQQGNNKQDIILGTESELLNRSLNINFNLRF